MAKASIKLDILLGRSKGGVFDARDNAVADKLRRVIEDKAGALARAAAEKRLETLEAAIVTAVERDLALFARTATTYFFRRRASTGPQFIRPPVVFAPRVATAAAGFKRTVSWKHIETNDDPLYWPGLSPATMRKKQRRSGPAATTYFIWNDLLRQDMETAFGDIVGRLFAPTVTFSRAAARDPSTGRFTKGTSIGKISVRVFRSSADVTAFLPAIRDADWAGASNDQALLVRYLSALTAAKLNNYHHGRPDQKRPWVGPSIAYWMIHRLPAVITTAIEGAVKGS